MSETLKSVAMFTTDGCACGTSDPKDAPTSACGSADPVPSACGSACGTADPKKD